jgi:hypothetical protein
VKPHQKNILAFPVFGDLQKIDDAQETRLSRQLWCNVGKTDRLDGVHFDLTFVHTVAGADSDVGAQPDADAARDLSTANSLAKTLREDHDESLHPGRASGSFRLTCRLLRCTILRST